MSLLAILSIVAPGASAQIVIRERVEVPPESAPRPVAVQPAAALAAGDEWTFEAGGLLQLRVGHLTARYGSTLTTSSKQCGAPGTATFTFTIHGTDGDRTVVVPVGDYTTNVSSYPTDVCLGDGDRYNASFTDALLEIGRVEADETVDVTYSVAGQSGPAPSTYFPAIDGGYVYDNVGDDGFEEHVYVGIPSDHHPSGGATIGPVAAVFLSDSLETEVTFSESVVSYGGSSALGVDRAYRPNDLFTVRLDEGAEFGTIVYETAEFGRIEGDQILYVRYRHLEAGAVLFVADEDFPGPSGLDATVGASITATSVEERPEAKGSLDVRAIWYEASADPNPVDLGDPAVLSVAPMDEVGAVGVDGQTPVTLSAYTADAVVVTLENTRTGETGTEDLVVLLSDLTSGTIQVRTEAEEGEPPPALAGARRRAETAREEPRRTSRATMARDRARAVAQQRRERVAARQGPASPVASLASADEDAAYVLIDIATHNDAEAEDYAIYGSVDLDVRLPALVIRFLRQDDTLIPTPAENLATACVRVSKFKTDEDLPGAVGFDSPYASGQPKAGDGDPDTFRPQVTGVTTGRAVDFRIEVERRGSIVASAAVGAVEGVQTAPSGTNVVTYRAGEHIRLVSNGRPPSGSPSGSRYDDDHAGDQTLRVELGDVVRAHLIVDGLSTGDMFELPVNRPANVPGEAIGPNTVLQATLNWRTPTGSAAVPETIAGRMSEDWAQAGIHFKNSASTAFDPNFNVVVVGFRGRGFLRLGGRFTEAPEAGSVSLTVAPAGGVPIPVNAPYGAGNPIGAVADAVRSAIIAATGLPGADVFVAPAEKGRYERFVVVAPTTQTTVGDFSRNDVVGLSGRRIRLNDIGSNQELNVIGIALKDPSDTTLDVIVVQDGGLPRQDPTTPGTVFGLTGWDAFLTSLPGVANTIFIVESAVDQNDDYGTVAGHEAGHALFERQFPGADLPAGSVPSDRGHTSAPQNLMYPVANEVETLAAPKRLTGAQQIDSRQDSGPGSSGPLLLIPQNR